METQRSTALYWPYYQAKSMEELKHSLVCATLELETIKLASQEEIRKRDLQLTHLQDLLNKAITERDEAQQNYKNLFLEKQLQKETQKIAPHQLHSGSSSSIDNNGGNFSSSDSDESIISSPLPSLQSAAVPETALQLLSSERELPEKGKLLQAVINAGPLLQSLLLAGPLPRWRVPPPRLESFDIPPVIISGIVNVNTEEFIYNGSNVCGDVNKKYQRVLLH